MLNTLAWSILLLPLFSAFAIGIYGVPRKILSGRIATGCLLASFACTSFLFLQVISGDLSTPIEIKAQWILLPDLDIQFGILLDSLSLLMSLIVTGVGSAIFIYSIGYMKDDAGYSRYFGMLSLFAFSMLTIVLSNNLIQLFIGWELVGFCSYALIGHWYEKPSAAEAGKKAFMVNRFADFGFMLGVILLWAISSPVLSDRSFSFQVLEQRLPSLLQTGLISKDTLSLAGLLIFCGVLGKSAQIPLHVWLPDAMEGPTPVSALIHAATMVAAGVYMLCRTFWLFSGLDAVLGVIAWTGIATAFFSGLLATVESDLKRILAYSTLSQLGYMVMAVGLGGAAIGMYHLSTHAFFKALLFLAAGSVIHATNRQNIWELGNLWRPMKVTSVAFLVGGLALCGFPGLSGFFSKDAILSLAHEKNIYIYWVAIITAGISAFYISRAWFVAFIGPSKEHHHAHESPRIMLRPLIFLTVLSVLGGYFGIPVFLGDGPEHFDATIAMASLSVAATGALFAYLRYSRGISVPKRISTASYPAYRLLLKKYYFDEIYSWYVEKIQQRIFAKWCSLFERHVIIETGVNQTAKLTAFLGDLLRSLQTGKVQTYATWFAFGAIVLLYVARIF